MMSISPRREEDRNPGATTAEQDNPTRFQTDSESLAAGKIHSGIVGVVGRRKTEDAKQRSKKKKKKKQKLKTMTRR